VSSTEAGNLQIGMKKIIFTSSSHTHSPNHIIGAHCLSICIQGKCSFTAHVPNSKKTRMTSQNIPPSNKRKKKKERKRKKPPVPVRGLFASRLPHSLLKQKLNYF